MTFNLQEISEALGNVTGGVRTGAEYDGLTTMGLSLDTDKAFGWPGGTFGISALQIHGRYVTPTISASQAVSGFQASGTSHRWVRYRRP